MEKPLPSKRIRVNRTVEGKSSWMMHKKIIALVILVISLVGSSLVLSQIINYPEPQRVFRYEVQIAFPNLSFDHPVGICPPGDGTNRLFVIGQMGLIYVFENHRSATAAEIFLDIHNQVHLGAFLGLAFHPNFAKNRQFYVNYLADNPLRSIISQWSVSPNNPNEADKNSQKILMEIPQLNESHAGGQLAFGPDHCLYIAVGDGSPYGDSLGNSQNRSTLQGKILRIDVDNPSQGKNYGIPPSNPFEGNTEGNKEEIYAYGFRNPWRFSYDFSTNKLWAGDVGQDRMEEIDVVEKGKNYGWNIMEGTLPYAGGNETGLELPIWAYGRDEGNATIGGFVYRGSKLTELAGSYVYGDYISGRIWSLNNSDASNLVNKELLKTNLNITSFGIDEKNELYICAQDGRIYQIIKSPT
jgi:glucose/arabinose dehydrogenase